MGASGIHLTSVRSVTRLVDGIWIWVMPPRQQLRALGTCRLRLRHAATNAKAWGTSPRSKQRNLKERQNLPNHREKGTRVNVRGVRTSLAINPHSQTGRKLGGKRRVWETAKGCERQSFPPLHSRQCYRVTHGFSPVGMPYFSYSSEHKRSNEKTDYRYRSQRLDTAARHIGKWREGHHYETVWGNRAGPRY